MAETKVAGPRDLQLSQERLPGRGTTEGGSPEETWETGGDSWEGKKVGREKEGVNKEAGRMKRRVRR